MLFIASFKITLVAGVLISFVVILLNSLVLKGSRYETKAVFSFGMIILAMFFGLGAYLRTIGVIFGPLSMVLGLILSLVSMFFYYFWKEGRKRVEFVVKQELSEEVKKKSLIQRIKELNERLRYAINFLKRVKSYKHKGHSLLFSIQLVYVEDVRRGMWQEPVNAIDFRILKEVKLIRNEYDEGGNKRII